MTSNDEIAAAFHELADLLELTDAERYRVLAYRRVAETISGIAKDLSSMSEGELKQLRGVGQATAAKVRELVETGTMKALEDTRASIPGGLLEMTRLRGLGPKKAMALHTELGISDLEALRAAAEQGRLRGVPGFGPKSEENILRAIAERRPKKQTFVLERALEAAERLIAGLREAGIHAEPAGSLRRMKETIGDIDLLAAGDPKEISEVFVSLPSVERVGASGGTKSSVWLSDGLQADLRVVAPDEWGAALQYFTGSKAHNVKVRERAVKMGMKLSEYGLFDLETGSRLASESEEEIYAALGMQTPPPTMREDRGEVELAATGGLPEVLSRNEIIGDLHNHTLYSDGTGTVGEMAEAAKALGYQVIGISDHGRNLLHVRHLKAQDIDKQADEIRRVEREVGIRILHGVELNIGPEGELDYPEELLAKFDYRIASVHQSLTMDRDDMTRRVVRALRSGWVNIFGHPTARRIGERQPIKMDLEEVFRTAASNKVALEVNAQATRLDLNDEHILLARTFGCLFCVDTDSHGPAKMGRMRMGVGMAQRGWASSGEVINAWPLEDLVTFLKR